MPVGLVSRNAIQASLAVRNRCPHREKRPTDLSNGRSDPPTQCCAKKCSVASAEHTERAGGRNYSRCNAQKRRERAMGLCVCRAGMRVCIMTVCRASGGLERRHGHLEFEEAIEFGARLDRHARVVVERRDHLVSHATCNIHHTAHLQPARSSCRRTLRSLKLFPRGFAIKGKGMHFTRI